MACGPITIWFMNTIAIKSMMRIKIKSEKIVSAAM